MAVRRRRSQGVGWGEGTKHVPFGSDSRIDSCRLDGVHDEYERHHHTGHNADAVYDFNGHDSGTDHHSELDHDHDHADTVDDDHFSANHDNDGCSGDNLHDPPDGRPG